MLNFTGQFLTQLPVFLMAEPVCYFVGIFVVACVADVINDFINL